MGEKLFEKSCLDFTELLASKAPVPGGGGAAALVGALGIALCSMVGNLTVGRRKYAGVEYDVKVMLTKAEKLQAQLLELIEEDAAVFEPLAKAYSIPKDDPKRAEILEEVTLNACKAPLKMMECCCGAIDLMEEMMEKGSETLISDTGCGALFCKAALEGASMNVFVNTNTIADKRKVTEIEAKADAMLAVYGRVADRIVAEVMRRQRGVE